MNDAEARSLLDERQAARRAKDFARADAIRDELAAGGFVVRDTKDGAVLERAASFTAVDPSAIPTALAGPATCRASVHLLYEGYPGDLERFLRAFDAHHAGSDDEVVVVDNSSDEGEAVEEIVRRHARARALHLDRPLGWAAARNAGLKTSAGAVVALADLSIEPEGDVLTPFMDALADPDVAVAGPFGLVSDDLRSWRDDPGPDVDAIEGYLLATRREFLARGLITERFKWYRNADIDLSFQLRAAAGDGAARVVPVPVRRHTHRGWNALDEAERARLSKRNHYAFFDRWKHREDLLRVNRGVG